MSVYPNVATGDLTSSVIGSLYNRAKDASMLAAKSKKEAFNRFKKAGLSDKQAQDAVDHYNFGGAAFKSRFGGDRLRRTRGFFGSRRPQDDITVSEQERVLRGMGLFARKRRGSSGGVDPETGEPTGTNGGSGGDSPLGSDAAALPEGKDLDSFIPMQALLPPAGNNLDEAIKGVGRDGEYLTKEQRVEIFKKNRVARDTDSIFDKRSERPSTPPPQSAPIQKVGSGDLISSAIEKVFEDKNKDILTVIKDTADKVEDNTEILEKIERNTSFIEKLFDLQRDAIEDAKVAAEEAAIDKTEDTAGVAGYKKLGGFLGKEIGNVLNGIFDFGGDLFDMFSARYMRRAPGVGRRRGARRRLAGQRANRFRDRFSGRNRTPRLPDRTPRIPGRNPLARRPRFGGGGKFGLAADALGLALPFMGGDGGIADAVLGGLDAVDTASTARSMLQGGQATSAATGGGATAGGVGAGTAAGIVGGVGLAMSGLGEGMFQGTRFADQQNAKMKDYGQKLSDEGNPLGMLMGGMGNLGMVGNEFNKIQGAIFDVGGAPFRYAIEGLMHPFLNEEQKENQAKNLAKFDSRVREYTRGWMNKIDFLDVIGDEKGAFGNIYGNDAAQKEMMDNMGYEFGGIADGPDTGYDVKLHGTEAIIPLDNKFTRGEPTVTDGGKYEMGNVNLEVEKPEEEEKQTLAEKKKIQKDLSEAFRMGLDLYQKKTPGGFLGELGNKIMDFLNKFGGGDNPDPGGGDAPEVSVSGASVEGSTGEQNLAAFLSTMEASGNQNQADAFQVMLNRTADAQAGGSMKAYGTTLGDQVMGREQFSPLSAAIYGTSADSAAAAKYGPIAAQLGNNPAERKQKLLEIASQENGLAELQKLFKGGSASDAAKVLQDFKEGGSLSQTSAQDIGSMVSFRGYSDGLPADRFNRGKGGNFFFGKGSKGKVGSLSQVSPDAEPAEEKFPEYQLEGNTPHTIVKHGGSYYRTNELGAIGGDPMPLEMAEKLVNKQTGELIPQYRLHYKPGKPPIQENLLNPGTAPFTPPAPEPPAPEPPVPANTGAAKAEEVKVSSAAAREATTAKTIAMAIPATPAPAAAPTPAAPASGSTGLSSKPSDTALDGLAYLSNLNQLGATA